MRYTALLLVCSLGLIACQKESAPVSVSNEQAQARVGSVTITETDLQDGLNLLSEKDRQFAQTPLGKQNFLQILTREKLILADAEAQGLNQQKDYVSLLEQKRTEQDRIYDSYAQQMLVRMWYDNQIKALEPTEKEIKEYYEKYPYEMTIKQIILDNAQTADQILRSLKSSPGRWKGFAQQYSIAPESLQTLTFMPGEYLESLEIIAANSATGRVEGFFKTSQGFHIIMKTNEKRLSFKEAEPRIRQILANQKLDQLLDTLKTKYEVIIYDKNE